MIPLADAAFRQAAAKILSRAKQTGTPLIIWQGDGVRAVPPDEVYERKADGPAAQAAAPAPVDAAGRRDVTPTGEDC